MKRLGGLCLVLAFMLVNYSYAQTTYFPGSSKMHLEGYTASLYSVELTDDYTFVTIELVPTRNLRRLTYFQSGYTHLEIGSFQIKMLGALSPDGNSFHSCEPDDGWGWSHAKKGEIYRYTLVFGGRIPHGMTTFSMVDDYYEYHGFSFRNYTINNPDPVEKTGYTEATIRSHSERVNDGIVGIYEEPNQAHYCLGCVKRGDGYDLIYLSGGEGSLWWNKGDLKARLSPTATPGLYKAAWYLMTKDLMSDCYVEFDGSSMHAVAANQKSVYIKTYPKYGAPTSISEHGKWSGTGFALIDGYIVTNYHVVDGANSIRIQQPYRFGDKFFNASVICVDEDNDLAIIKVNDIGLKSSIKDIPYSLSFSTADVGDDCFALGYPMTTTMGTEIKLTNGIISSRTGYQGDISSYQVSVPIQPGNSGGPLFNSQGEVIGIINAKHSQAENASYAIKTSYLKNLIESYTYNQIIPSSRVLQGKRLSEQVKSITPFVFLIHCEGTIK